MRRGRPTKRTPIATLEYKNSDGIISVFQRTANGFVLFDENQNIDNSQATLNNNNNNQNQLNLEFNDNQIICDFNFINQTIQNNFENQNHPQINDTENNNQSNIAENSQPNNTLVSQSNTLQNNNNQSNLTEDTVQNIYTENIQDQYISDNLYFPDNNEILQFDDFINNFSFDGHEKIESDLFDSFNNMDDFDIL